MDLAEVLEGVSALTGSVHVLHHVPPKPERWST